MDVSKKKSRLSDQEFHELILKRMQPMITRLSVDKAITNDVVLQYLFRYLKLKDLKNVRLVCSYWKRLCEPLFRKRSQIVLSLTQPNSSMKEFNKLFGDSISSKFPPFTSLKLHCCLPLHYSEFTDFFYGEGHFITSLTLLSSTFMDENQRFLGSVNVNKLIGPNLRQINLSSQKTSLIVSTERLALAKDIVLSNCILDVNDGRLFPVKLELDNTTVIKNGVTLTTVNVDDFVNYEQLEILKLACASSTTKEFLLHSKKPPVRLKKFCLSNVKVGDWEGISWKFDKLSTIQMNWDKKTRMEIININIINSALVDLSLLPSTVEKLSVMNSRLTKSEEEISNLTKLQSLRLFGEIRRLKYFADCPNLNTLELISVNDRVEESILMKCIPKSLKKLKLVGYKIRFVGKTFPHLQQLIIEGEQLNMNLAKFLRRWNPREIVVTCNKFAEEVDRMDQRATELVTNSFACGVGNIVGKDRFCRSLWIGPFKWRKEEDFQKFDQLTNVGIKSSFYCFENGKGRAVQKSELPQS